jgi:hypothetical protein
VPRVQNVKYNALLPDFRRTYVLTEVDGDVQVPFGLPPTMIYKVPFKSDIACKSR